MKASSLVQIRKERYFMYYDNDLLFIEEFFRNRNRCSCGCDSVGGIGDDRNPRVETHLFHHFVDDDRRSDRRDERRNNRRDQFCGKDHCGCERLKDLAPQMVATIILKGSALAIPGLTLTHLDKKDCCATFTATMTVYDAAGNMVVESGSTLTVDCKDIAAVSIPVLSGAYS